MDPTHDTPPDLADKDAQDTNTDPGAKDYNRRTPFTCGSCPATWTGMSMAHCATCHWTFGSVNSFDRHRGAARGHQGCAPPALIGLTWNDTRNCWSEAYNAGKNTNRHPFRGHDGAPCLARTSSEQAYCDLPESDSVHG